MYLSKRFIIIPIYFIMVNLFSMFIQYLEYTDLLFCDDCSEDYRNTVFDYIVVGSGSAGALIARRLAEDKNIKVLVLEAGKQRHGLMDIPSIGLLLQKTNFDWQYITTPQTTSCLALDNNASRWPMGKIVGGTSMLNNMIYVRGHPADFNEWFNDKQSYDYTSDVLPYFEKLEGSLLNDNSEGSVYVTDLIFTSALPKFILGAAKTLGFSVLDDAINCKQGFGMPKVNVHDGLRWTTSHRLLNSNKPNVFLKTNRFVEKVLLRYNFEAYGVKYSFQDKSYYAKASKGVILSAGTIGTPKILLLSGIGPIAHLDEHNIKTKINLPVGDNLQDHVTTGFDLVLLNQTLGIGIEQMLSPYSVIEYFWTRSGPWTTCGCEVLAFIDTKRQTRNESNVQPDLQLMVMPLGINEDHGVHLRGLIGISDYTWDNYFGPLDQTTMTILPILLHPRSRGTVRLRDTNFRSMPVIDPKYLSEQNDVDILLKGIDLIKNLIKTQSMQELGAELNKNHFPGCESFEFDTKAYWECYVRHLTVTSYHPVGTCKMGDEKDPTSVVNLNFEVRGTNNLFVVDASVMPTITSGNVNGATLMLAEMASDKIKFRNYLSKGKCSIRDIFIFKDFC